MTRHTPPTLSRHQSGFSLIDVLLALGVVILISGITLNGIRRNNESNQAKAVGEQMKLVGTALNSYVSLRYDFLVAHVPGTDDVGNPGTAADPGPRSCVWITAGSLKMCTVTSETLRRNGLVPNSFSGYNAFGSTYQYRIRVDTTGATPLVDGLAWTDEAYMMEGENRYDLLGQAMLVAGADSGMTRSTAARVEGFNGAWAEENMGVAKLGVLAFRSGYNTSGFATYLRLSGGRMTGDIDMGAKDIYNIQDLKASNIATNEVRMKKDTNGIVFSDPAAFNTANDNTIATAAASDPRIGTVGLALALRSDAPVRIETASSGALGDVVMDELAVNGISNTANYSSSGSISAQGTITTTNQIRGSQLIAGTGGANGNSYIFGGSDGGIYFNTSTAGTGADTRGIQLTAATNTITLIGGSNLYTAGNIRSGGDVTADSRVVVGSNEIILDSTSNPAIGAACVVGSSGTMARSSSGELVQCISDGTSYRWRTMGSSIAQATGAQTCTGAGSALGNQVDIVCPAGYSIVTGGYSYANGAVRGTAAVNTRLDNTTWRVRAGATAAYLGTESVATCFNTYAICSR